ncbi:hypothetical protein DFH06DRAFT_994401, partial [Mycena polygramma]
MAFSEYATPVPTLKYSPQYFSSLTFARVENLDYPDITTSPSTIERWCFSNDIPTTATGNVIQPGERIPRLQDLLPISRDMERAFTDGARSVDIVLNVGGGQRVNTQFHFSKIRLLIAVNNNHAAILGAQNLLQHIVDSALLSPADLERFRALHIFGSIFGFQSTQFPLWQLACLLGETWLEEDVVNALLELLYLKETMNSTDDPSLIILSTA